MDWLRLRFNDSFKRGELYITTTPVSIEYCVSESSFYNIFSSVLACNLHLEWELARLQACLIIPVLVPSVIITMTMTRIRMTTTMMMTMMMTMTIIIKTMILTMMNIGEIRMDPHTSTVKGIIANMSKFNVMVLVIHFGGRSLGWTCRVLCWGFLPCIPLQWDQNKTMNSMRFFLHPISKS